MAEEKVAEVSEEVKEMASSLLVADAVKFLIRGFNLIEEEDISRLLRVANHKHTLDPLIDPTRYRNEMNSITQGETILRAMLEFKKVVNGIGSFK